MARVVLLIIPILLSGCTALHVAGDVAEGAVKTTGAVVGAAADKVTTSDEERAKKNESRLNPPAKE